MINPKYSLIAILKTCKRIIQRFIYQIRYSIYFKKKSVRFNLKVCKNANEIISESSSRQEFIKIYGGVDVSLTPPVFYPIILMCLMLEKDFTKLDQYLENLESLGELVRGRIRSTLNLDVLLPVFYLKINESFPSNKERDFISRLIRLFTVNYDDIINGQRQIVSNDLFDFERLKFNPELVEFHSFFRRHWWEFDETTRLHDIGPRTHQAFLDYGCASYLYNTDHNGFEAAISSTSGLNKISVALIDIQSIFLKDVLKQKPGLFEQLQCRFQYIVAVAPDAWREDARLFMDLYHDYFDLIWVQGYSQMQEYQKNYNVDAMFSLFPPGLSVVDLQKKHQLNKILFQGSFEDTNISRIAWHNILMKRSGLFHFNVHSHFTDGIGPMHSFKNYLEAISEYKYGISFVTRNNGYRSPIGRSLEIPYGGSLLIQEYSSDFTYYMRPGLHFLDFRNLNDIQTILETIACNHNYYDDLQMSGNAKAVKDFGNAGFVEHFFRKLNI